MSNQLDLIRSRLEVERGTLLGHGRRAVALVYPSPYSVGMSSLGFQQVYRLLNALPDTVAERAFLPDSDDDGRGPLLTYESGRPAANFGVLAYSLAYELELPGLFATLERAGVPVLREERHARHPWVVVGGPLTFVNPAPLAPFADVVVLGEVEPGLAALVDGLFAGDERAVALRRLAELPGLFVPSVMAEVPPGLARAAREALPAVAAITTPHASLADMFLVEAERGCARACAFCVMRRQSGVGVDGGMRIVPAAQVLASIAPGARRVGLVGAAVSDHPELEAIVRALVERGCEVGLSSLRAERVSPGLLTELVRGGMRTLTIAADGASERLRDTLSKGVHEADLLAAASLAGELGLPQLKNYVMLGVPGESDADLDELVACSAEMAKRAGGRTKIVLGISPFVPKPRTPLCDAPFAGIRTVATRVATVRDALGAKVDVRAVSSRWAWVEYELARGDAATGLAALRAHREGGSFAAWKKALGRRE